MFVINELQFKALELAQEDKFIARMAAFMFQRFPDSQHMPRETLLAEIRRQLKNANSYQLVTEQAVATYVITAWIFGVDFDKKFPAAQDILSSNLSPEDKQHWLAKWAEEIFNTFDEGRN